MKNCARQSIRLFFPVLLLGVLAFESMATAQPSITNIAAPSGTAISSVLSLSEDGSTVVGGLANARVLRWTRAGGSQQLGTLNDILTGAPTAWMTPVAMSGNGAVGIGFYSYNSFGRAFRWSAGGGVQDLGSLADDWTYSWAKAISADGAVIVGGTEILDGPPSQPYLGHYHACRWIGGAINDLGTLPGTTSSECRSVSRDGAVVVGVCDTVQSIYFAPVTAPRAFRWTAATGMQDLGPLPTSTGYSLPVVSTDGSAVAGLLGDRVFRWTVAEGMQDLGALPGASSSSLSAISGDGSTVVGASGGHAFRWTAAGGMQDLGVLAGVPGSPTSVAAAVSADGSTVVGRSGTHAFLWTPSLGMVDLNTHLHTLGLNLQGQVFQTPKAISADGLVILVDNSVVVLGDPIVPRWKLPVSGSWTVASNWEGNVVPASDADVLFDQQGTYTVSNVPFSAARSVRVSAGDVTFASSQPVAAVLGDLSVSGARLTLQLPTTIEAGSVTIGEAGYLAASGVVFGPVSNRGELHARLGPTDYDYSYAGIEVFGTFTQYASGTLGVEVGGANTLDSSRIVLNDAATFDGRLRIIRSAGYTPTPGDRITVVSDTASVPITGRFTDYDGQAVNSWVFFGVDQDASAFVLTPTRSRVEVLALTPPRRIGYTGDPSLAAPVERHTHLALVTHGWNADIFMGGSPQLDRIALAMTNFELSRGDPVDTWDVVEMDWSQFNGFFSGPVIAGRRAREIGESLWQWLFDLERTYPGGVHAVGHSAGSWMANEVVKGAVSHLQASPAGSGLTLLDGFLAPSLIQKYSNPGLPNVKNEQYIDTLNGFAIDTSMALINFVNFDVTRAPGAPLCPLATVGCTIDHHAWPVEWYAETCQPNNSPVIPPCPGSLLPGFQRSPMFRAYAASAGCIPPDLNPGALYTPTNETMLPAVLRLLSTLGISPASTTPGTTGTVTFPTPGAVRLQTGSPVEATVVQTVSERALACKFDMRFTSAAASVVALYQGDTLLALFTESDVRQGAGANGQTSSGLVVLRPAPGPGPVSLTFRVEPTTSASSILTISGLVFFGSSTCVADFDQSGTVTVQDIFQFLNAWFAGNVRADVNGGGLSVQDIFDFLNAWFAGCP